MGGRGGGRGRVLMGGDFNVRIGREGGRVREKRE